MILVKKTKIRREIKILQTLKNGVNIINLIDVVRQLKETITKQDKYIQTIPDDLRTILDNAYIDFLYRENSILFDALFGPNAETVSWFLYEWKANSTEPQIILNDGTYFILAKESDFYNYLDIKYYHQS